MQQLRSPFFQKGVQVRDKEDVRDQKVPFVRLQGIQHL